MNITPEMAREAFVSKGIKPVRGSFNLRINWDASGGPEFECVDTRGCAVSALVHGERLTADDITAFIPFTPEWAHAIAAFAVGAALGAGAFGLSYLYQKRLMAEAQALVPGGLQ